jgi:hypothetical protein
MVPARAMPTVTALVTLDKAVPRYTASGWDADINAAGDQAFTFVGSAAFTGTAGELRTTFDGVDTWVQGDISGDGVADFEIVLSGAVSLSSTDFIL